MNITCLWEVAGITVVTWRREAESWSSSLWRVDLDSVSCDSLLSHRCWALNGFPVRQNGGINWLSNPLTHLGSRWKGGRTGRTCSCTFIQLQPLDKQNSKYPRHFLTATFQLPLHIKTPPPPASHLRLHRCQSQLGSPDISSRSDSTLIQISSWK